MLKRPKVGEWVRLTSGNYQAFLWGCLGRVEYAASNLIQIRYLLDGERRRDSNLGPTFIGHHLYEALEPATPTEDELADWMLLELNR
jgi:hypothetical protein